MSNFLHLGARSDYSLGESLARVDHLCRTAASHAQDALAICDLMSLAGVRTLASTSRTLGIKPIYGLEARVLPFHQPRFDGRLTRVRLIASDNFGFRRLVSLVNAGQARVREGFPSFVTWDELLAEPAGLLYLLGGAHGEMTVDSPPEEVESMMETLLARIPRDQVYIALPAPCTPALVTQVRFLDAIAAHFEVTSIAVPEVHCTAPEDDLAWQLLQAPVDAATEPPTKLGQLARPLRERSHLLSSTEAAALYSEQTEALEATATLADRCRVELQRQQHRFPRHEYERGVDAESWIWNTIFSKAHERYGDLPTRWRERLNREFRDFSSHGLAEALVSLSRLDKEFQHAGILRGPGAGFLTDSLIACLLGLTRVDPIHFNLAFALPESVSRRFPTLELCVSESQLGAARRTLEQLFENRICQVGRWQRWSTNAALQRVLEVTSGPTGRQASKITKSTAWRTAQEQAAIAPVGQDPDPETLLTDESALAWITKRLDGRARSLQPAGDEFAICDEELQRIVPFVQSSDGDLLSQWDSDSLEVSGLGRIRLKLDSSLDLVCEGTRWAREQGNRNFEPSNVAFDDPETFKLLREGATAGIELLESPIVKMRLRAIQPTDLTGLVALLTTKGEGSCFPEPPGFEPILLAYQSAVIKAHEPAAFFAAALSCAGGDRRRVAALLGEAARRGIPTRPPDINLSAWAWAPEGKALRAGLLLVKEFTRAAFEELVTVRRELCLNDLADLMRRSDPRILRTRHVEQLIRSGALDSMGQGRRPLMELLPELDELLRPRKRRVTGQDPLAFFGQSGEWWVAHHVSAVQRAVTDSGMDEELAWLAAEERAATGLAFTINDKELYEPFLKGARITEPGALKLRDKDHDSILTGTVDAIQPDPRFPEGVLADVEGCMVIARGEPARVLSSDRAIGAPVIVAGRLTRNATQWILEAEIAITLEDAASRAERGDAVEIDVGRHDIRVVKQLIEICREYPGDTPIRLTGAPVNSSRAHHKLAARKVLVCPGLELALLRLLGRIGWQFYVRPSETTPDKSFQEQPTSALA